MPSDLYGFDLPKVKAFLPVRFPSLANKHISQRDSLTNNESKDVSNGKDIVEDEKTKLNQDNS